MEEIELTSAIKDIEYVKLLIGFSDACQSAMWSHRSRKRPDGTPTLVIEALASGCLQPSQPDLRLRLMLLACERKHLIFWIVSICSFF